MTDDGLRFHAILQKANGDRHTRETDSRLVLLAWIDQHQQEGDTLVELSMVASGPALGSMLWAIRYVRRLDEHTLPFTLPPIPIIPTAHA